MHWQVCERRDWASASSCADDSVPIATYAPGADVCQVDGQTGRLNRNRAEVVHPWLLLRRRESIGQGPGAVIGCAQFHESLAVGSYGGRCPLGAADDDLQSCGAPLRQTKQHATGCFVSDVKDTAPKLRDFLLLQSESGEFANV